MRLIAINKRPYAVGLLWFTPDDNGKSSRITLRKYAAAEADRQASGLDLVAFRNKQFGLGAGGGNALAWANARSLAAALNAPPSFLGLFQLEDIEGKPFWWVYASTAGQLSEQADALFDTRDAAKTYIKQSLVDLLGDFSEEVECGSHAESQTWLALLLVTDPLRISLTLRDPSRLTPVQQTPEHRRNLVTVAAALTLFGFGMYAVSAFFEHRAAQQALEAARLATLDKERRRQELMQHPDQVFPPVWASAPRADLLADACMRALLEQPTALSGWELAGAACGATVRGKALGSLVLTWEHRPGADYLRLPSMAKLTGTNKAVTRQPLNVTKAFRLDGNFRTLLPRETATRVWYQLTQQLGSRLRFTIAPPAKSTVDGIELVAPWQRGAWELADVPDLVLLDGSLFHTLARLPGLVVDQIIYDGAWTLKGSLYVQN